MAVLDKSRSEGRRPGLNTKADGAVLLCSPSDLIVSDGSVQRPFVSAIILHARRNGSQVRRPPSCSASKVKISLEVGSALEKIGVAVNRTGAIFFPTKRQEMATASPALGRRICCSSDMAGASGTTCRAKARPRDRNPSLPGALLLDSSYILPPISNRTSKPRRVISL